MAKQYSRKRKRKIKWFLTFALFLFLLSVRLVEDIGLDQRSEDRFIVARVLDGDTVELQGGDKLRLLSIDTPEKGEPFYEEAKNYLSSIALGKHAKIQFGKVRRDKYGRLLGYLFVDSIHINKKLIENGLAYLYLFKDNDFENKFLKEMFDAQKIAIVSKIGIWGLDRFKEDFYINKSGSFRLHRPDCRSAKKLVEGRYQKFEDRNDGFLLGLSPCRNCKP